MQTHKITPVVKPRTCMPRVKDVYNDDKDYMIKIPVRVSQ